MRIAIWLNSEAAGCWNFSKTNLSYLQKKMPNATITVCSNATEFIRALPQAETVLTWTFEQEWFNIAKSLKWIYTPAAGRDYFSIQPPEQIKVSYGAFHGELIGETVLAMMLASCRGIITTARTNDPWSARTELAQTMRPLRGSHITILGFGAIGEWIGRLAKPFGVKITGIKRQRAPLPAYFDDDDSIVTVDQLNQILPMTDHLIIVLPRNPASELIINRQRLALLPKRAIIYNVGRGNAIDEQALAEALINHQLAGACLDVFATEPLPITSPLTDAPRLLLSPHSSALAPNYLTLFIDEFVDASATQ